MPRIHTDALVRKIIGKGGLLLYFFLAKQSKYYPFDLFEDWLLFHYLFLFSIISTELFSHFPPCINKPLEGLKMNRPAPVEISYDCLRFLITHNPTNAQLGRFIEVAHLCNNTYISISHFLLVTGSKGDMLHFKRVFLMCRI